MFSLMMNDLSHRWIGAGRMVFNQGGFGQGVATMGPSSPMGHGPAGNNDEHHQRLIDEFDEDGDGELSETEREAAHAAMEAKMIEQFDKNGDGVLSDDERPEPPSNRGPMNSYNQRTSNQYRNHQSSSSTKSNSKDLSTSRQTMRTAYQNLMSAIKSGDSDAIAEAKEAMEAARSSYQTIRQSYSSK